MKYRKKQEYIKQLENIGVEYVDKTTNGKRR